MNSRPHCVILHPSLGYGGAERLILQLAEGLAENGWRCTLLVPGRKPKTGFTVSKSVAVVSIRAFVPPSLGGRLKAWCAYFRMRACLAAVVALRADLIVTDLVPHLIPAIKARLPATPVLNYCHFPDRLLAPLLKGAWYQSYRKRFDHLELQGFLLADRILVNSAFTRQKLREAYPPLATRQIDVVHPGIAGPPICPHDYLLAEKKLVISLGRIHPAKNHRLTLEAFAAARIPAAVRLAICGGYDESDAQCRDEARRLTALIKGLGIESRVDFYLNPGDGMLETLWRQAAVLLYPPLEEHFGLVPLEAMVRGVPVIAVDAGGPREIVVAGETGLLVPAEGSAFARALEGLFADPGRAASFSAAGYARALGVFPLSAFYVKVATHAASVAGLERLDENQKLGPTEACTEFQGK